MEEIRLEGINMMVMGTVVATDVVEVVVGVIEVCALAIIGAGV